MQERCLPPSMNFLITHFLLSPDGSCGGRDFDGAGESDLDTGSRGGRREEAWPSREGRVGRGDRSEVG